LCTNCGLERRLLNIAQLERGSGPYFDHWARRCYLAMRRRVVALETQVDNAGAKG
jgi:hypothetical protein